MNKICASLFSQVWKAADVFHNHMHTTHEQMQNQPMTQAVDARAQRKAPNVCLACSTPNVLFLRCKLCKKSIMWNRKRGHSFFWIELSQRAEVNTLVRGLYCVWATCRTNLPKLLLCCLRNLSSGCTVWYVNVLLGYKLIWLLVDCKVKRTCFSPNCSFNRTAFT